MAPPGPKGPFSENWLVEAILVTLLCCLPFGVVGIIFAAQVNTKQQAGDMEGAENQEKKRPNGRRSASGLVLDV